MTIGAMLGLGCACLLIHPIRTDFKIDVQSPPPVAQALNTTQQQPTLNVPIHRGTKRPQVPLAIGFGHDVPLDFAVQQVVPRFMTVDYGDTVDRELRVTWQGGRPWPQVRQSVLQPAGLHMHIVGQKLFIAD